MVPFVGAIMVLPTLSPIQTLVVLAALPFAYGYVIWRAVQQLKARYAHE